MIVRITLSNIAGPLDEEIIEIDESVVTRDEDGEVVEVGDGYTDKIRAGFAALVGRYHPDVGDTITITEDRDEDEDEDHDEDEDDAR